MQKWFEPNNRQARNSLSRNALEKLRINMSARINPVLIAVLQSKSCLFIITPLLNVHFRTTFDRLQSVISEKKKISRSIVGWEAKEAVMDASNQNFNSGEKMSDKMSDKMFLFGLRLFYFRYISKSVIFIHGNISFMTLKSVLCAVI